MCKTINYYFALTSDVEWFNEIQQPLNKELRKLMNDLLVEGNKEKGIDEVDVKLVATESGKVYDIHLNGKSIGYNAVKLFVETSKSLSLPDHIARGTMKEVDETSLSKMHDRLFIVSLFGDFLE